MRTEVGAEEQPCIFRQIGEQFLPNGDDADTSEVTAQALQQYRRIRRMTDLCGDDKGQAAARLEQAGACHQKRRPRSRQAIEVRTEPRGQRQSSLANLPAKELITD